MINLDLKWKKDKKWLIYSCNGLVCEPKEDAPKEVWDSYNNYLKQKEEAIKKEKEEGIILI